MSHRLQVLIPEALDARIAKAAQRSRMTKGEWVRRVLTAALDQAVGARARTADPLTQLAALNGPSANIEQMLSEIEAGRG